MAFELPVRPALGRAAFLVAPANAAALAAIEGWRSWPAARLALAGPAGAGKTHLAHVWAAACPGARILPAAALEETAVPALAATPLAIEDAGALAGDAPGEAALLHLVNLMAERRLPLLLSARTAPAQWPLALPDLASRLQATALARIAAPDDPLLAAVLVKHFADRQVAVSPALVGWLVARIERSFAATERAAALLDAAALARGVAITPRLAAEVLAGMLDSGPPAGKDGVS